MEGRFVSYVIPAAFFSVKGGAAAFECIVDDAEPREHPMFLNLMYI